MKRLILVFIGLAALMMLTLPLSRVMGWFDPVATLETLWAWASSPESRNWTMVAVVGILAADSLWAVPNMTVMVLAGAMLGPWWGAIAGTLGLGCASFIGYGVGRLGGPALLRRWCTPGERRKIAAFAQRDLWFTLVITRSLPILPDLTAVMAGMTKVPIWRMTLWVLAGAVPLGLASGLAGSMSSLEWIWPALLVILGLPTIGLWAWWLRRRPLEPGTVLVTGASSGIGAAVARRFARMGWRVLAHGRDHDRLALLEREALGRVEPIIADISTAAGCRSLVDAVSATTDQLDLLIHNAGIQVRWLPGNPAPPWDELEREQAVNLIAPMFITEGCLPLLERAPAPRVVAMSSGLAYVPKRMAPGYGASKAGLNHWLWALRLRVKMPVVEVVLPLVDTPMTAGRGRRKLPPHAVAEALVRGLERGRTRILVGVIPLFLVIRALWPSLATRIVQESQPSGERPS